MTAVVLPEPDAGLPEAVVVSAGVLVAESLVAVLGAVGVIAVVLLPAVLGAVVPAASLTLLPSFPVGGVTTVPGAAEPVAGLAFRSLVVRVGVAGAAAGMVAAASPVVLLLPAVVVVTALPPAAPPDVAGVVEAAGVLVIVLPAAALPLLPEAAVVLAAPEVLEAALPFVAVMDGPVKLPPVPIRMATMSATVPTGKTTPRMPGSGDCEAIQVAPSEI
ncbi:hypothetical protein GCM10008957_21070 [Deinococcus ruber]|uniref:Uncharacterized protein n=1 Tax=Deinococcus ruber TaxID=1848197 RepID=A0A918C5L9_9DEIO|nr:hypothetical protein GCM10008957_21070 [Deinococcus ruber]